MTSPYGELAAHACVLSALESLRSGSIWVRRLRRIVLSSKRSRSLVGEGLGLAVVADRQAEATIPVFPANLLCLVIRDVVQIPVALVGSLDNYDLGLGLLSWDGQQRGQVL